MTKVIKNKQYENPEEYENFILAENRIVSFFRRRLVKKMIALGNIKSNEIILDIGSGTGNVIQYYKEFVGGGGNIVASDPFVSMLKYSIQKGRSPEHNVICVAEFLPFKNNSFDHVVANGILHHIADPYQAVKEMIRVACKNILIDDITVLNKESWYGKRFLSKLILDDNGISYFTKKEWKDFIEKFGLEYEIEHYFPLNLIFWKIYGRLRVVLWTKNKGDQ